MMILAVLGGAALLFYFTRHKFQEPVFYHMKNLTGRNLLMLIQAQIRIESHQAQKEDRHFSLYLGFYLAGVHDAYSVALGWFDASQEQFLSAVVAFLAANPTRLDEPASVLVRAALLEAFVWARKPDANSKPQP